MPELGQMEARQAAALAGLAPVTRQSGKWKGHAHIQGGRAGLRRSLYMPALVATRYNAPLREKYQKLIASGKAAKIALTAIMRKLIVLANALLRQNRKWTPNASC
jgi:transposase